MALTFKENQKIYKIKYKDGSIEDRGYNGMNHLKNSIARKPKNTNNIESILIYQVVSIGEISWKDIEEGERLKEEKEKEKQKRLNERMKKQRIKDLESELKQLKQN